MNIGVILNYFQYFLSFPTESRRNTYHFITSRPKFVAKEIEHLTCCDVKSSKLGDFGSKGGEWEDYFRIAVRLKSVPSGLNLQALSAFYEECFMRFITQNCIDVLIGGATTGFERCGLATAKRLGIRTLYVWEGFFRPDTISYDRKGMNAESSFCTLSFDEICGHEPTPRSLAAVELFEKQLRGSNNRPSLGQIHDGRFSILRQARNRFQERADVERIRLPFSQFAQARLAYYWDRPRYSGLADLRRPFFIFLLQMHTDSNVVLSTDLFPYKDLVAQVLEAFQSVRRALDCDLVIKEHPLDVFRMRYPIRNENNVVWLKPEIPTPQILAHQYCRGTIVANSTSGFESLLLGKPVLALGRSVYAHEELVEVPRNMSVSGLSESLIKLKERKLDTEATHRFACCLFDRMQLCGNLDRSPSLSEIESFEHLFAQEVGLRSTQMNAKS